MKKFILFIFLINLLLYTNFSFPWGSTGHRITAQIAENYLDHSAKIQIKKILGGQSLAEVSTWADEVRSDPNKKYYDKFSPWHYVEIPDGLTYEKSTKNPDGDIVTALNQTVEKLKSKKATLEQKAESLKLLVHFMGDLHQPLHVGNGKDRGGNWCYVKWFNQSNNLHRVWDESLIDYSNLSFTEYIQFIDKTNSKDRREISKGNILSWTHESMSLRDQLYPESVSDETQSKESSKNYCKQTDIEKIPDSAIPNLGYDYHYQHKKLLNTQLLNGGIRLAHLLNTLF